MGCECDNAGMAIYLAPIGSGIGDFIVCRPVFDWLVENSAGQPVYMVARGPRQVGLAKLLPQLAGEVNELALRSLLRPGDRYINLRDHPSQRNYDWLGTDFKSAYPNFRVQEILQAICRDFGLHPDVWQMKPFEYRSDARTRNKLALVPGTTMKKKTLRAQVWQKLHEQLKERGIESVMLGYAERCETTRELVALGVPYLDTGDFAQALDLVSNAAAVISVDTGLMHLAVQQGINTLAIFGAWDTYYRPAPHCTPVFTASLEPDDTRPLELKDFPVEYHSWDWFPPDSLDGDYLDVEAERLIEWGIAKIKPELAPRL